jgi:hypothetical protein
MRSTPVGPTDTYWIPGRAPLARNDGNGGKAEEAFSEVTGGRALSFHGLAMGEAPGPERKRGEQREGAELPCR